MRRNRLVTILWGLGVPCMLAVGLFVSGDQPGSKCLKCTDLLDMPLEALMEVRIVSSDGGAHNPRHSIGDWAGWEAGPRFSRGTVPSYQSL